MERGDDFFAFGSTSSVPENGQVNIQFTGVDIGNFDLSQAYLELTGAPESGTITQPIEIERTDQIVTWESTYTSTEDIGGIDDRVVGVRPMLARITNWIGYLSAESLNSMSEDIKKHGRTGRPAGDSAFIERLECLTGRTLTRGKPGPKPRIK